MIRPVAELPILPLDDGQSCCQSGTAGDAGLLSLEEIEGQVREFEQNERDRLGLRPEEPKHWHDPNPQTFTRAQRDETTIMIGGLTIAHDQLIQAALRSLNYRIDVLDCPDNRALQLGKEFGNRGQCNPTYFTVGNLIKQLVYLRDVEKVPVKEIVEKNIFLTAGACGPCRFGTYVTEYRKALRDAGFDGFRVVLFQQTGGLKQATGEENGLELNPTFFIQIVKAILAGDVVNAMGYRIRPYEVNKGQTNEVLEQCKQTLCEAFSKRSSIVRALLRCRKQLAAIEVDRLQSKPKVMIIGEFWAMTTEGDGNYHLQQFLEEQGAEVDIQLVAAWLLYMIWNGNHDTKQRMTLRGEDEAKKGLAGKNVKSRLRQLWLGEKVLRGIFGTFAWAIGLKGYHLPDMNEIANLAGEYYDHEVRGGEGHMEVGKLIQSVTKKKAHMVLSVKPFGCMPSSGVSDGIQSLVQKKFPEAVFCPVETTGDGAVNFQSRVMMYLFKARRNAKSEFEEALDRQGLSLDEARVRQRRRRSGATFYPRHVYAGTGTNQVLMT